MNLKEGAEGSKYRLSFVVKNEDFTGSFDQIWKTLHGNNSNPKVGMIIGDSKNGQIAEEFMKYIDNQPHSKIEVINFFNDCFMVKD